jgi:hypothetical protein
MGWVFWCQLLQNVEMVSYTFADHITVANYVLNFVRHISRCKKSPACAAQSSQEVKGGWLQLRAAWYAIGMHACHPYKRGSKGGWIHASRAAGFILLVFTLHVYCF